jgi:hypothetical protein
MNGGGYLAHSLASCSLQKRRERYITDSAATEPPVVGLVTTAVYYRNYIRQTVRLSEAIVTIIE